MAPAAASPPCLWCGQPEEISLREIWETGEFMLDTCCYALHEELVEEMNQSAEFRTELLRQLGAEKYLGECLRRVPACDGQFLLDWNLRIHEISLSEARAFVDVHHAHHKASVGWRFGAAIHNGPQRIGVAMVGRPVARMLDPNKILEVNRLCVRRDIPAELVWNACSQLYGWAAREAKQRGFEKIITYTLETEPGTSLRAAGWQPEGLTRGGSWSRRNRSREDVAPTVRKMRWCRKFAATKDQPRGVRGERLIAPTGAAAARTSEEVYGYGDR